MGTTLELASPDVVAERFQEGLVILNLETGQYFDVGDRAVPLLDALSQGIDVEALKSALEEREQGASQQAEQAIAKMVEFGLLRQKPAAVDRLDARSVDAIIAAGQGYHIECHSDLAELIAADPIHDLDPATGKLNT